MKELVTIHVSDKQTTIYKLDINNIVKLERRQTQSKIK